MEYLALCALVLVVLWVLYWRRQRRIQREHAHQLQQSLEAGLGETPSLHPVVDAARCLASSSCVKACPEQALGIVEGTAVLVNAAACIGHGACAAACPVDAITLVFGTEKRGIDIPAVTPEFESNVPGLFIAGKLGGMGLIRKAASRDGRPSNHCASASPGPARHAAQAGCAGRGIAQGSVPADRSEPIRRAVRARGRRRRQCVGSRHRRRRAAGNHRHLVVPQRSLLARQAEESPRGRTTLVCQRWRREWWALKDSNLRPTD